MTYGVAFQLINEAALDYLNNREVALGGYISHIAMFIPRDPSRMPMPVLLYVATPSNQHWLGHAASENIANQVQYVLWSLGSRNTCQTFLKTTGVQFHEASFMLFHSFGSRFDRAALAFSRRNN